MHLFYSSLKKFSLAILVLVSIPSFAALKNEFYLDDIHVDKIQGKLQKVRTTNSLIIRDPAILALIEKEHSLGLKLGELAYHEKVLGRVNGGAAPDFRFDVSDGPSFIWRAFTASDEHVTLNNQYMDDARAYKISKNPKDAPKNAPIMPYARAWNYVTNSDVASTAFRSTAIGIDRHTNITPYQNIINLWPELKRADNGYRIHKNLPRNVRYHPLTVGDGPFRLIAVINRMDMSGNLPRGSGPYGFVDPRAFGEVHFIYGLIDKNYETKTGQAYPHTMQVTYRLPPLSASYAVENQNRGNVSTHEKFMLSNGLSSWREHNTRWAKLWGQLSRLDIKRDKQAFANHLHAILERAAVPGNFLNLNSNSKVGGYIRTKNKRIYGGENELKAYYSNQSKSARQLFPTSLERDAFRCMVNTGYLRDVINGYTMTYPKDGDYFNKPVVDIMSWNPNFNSTISNYSGINAYMLANNSKTPSSKTHPALDGKKSPHFSATYLNGCYDSDNGNSPFRLEKAVEDERIMAPSFSRTSNKFAWELPNKPGLPNVTEQGRHAFAIRSCSGCHGKETGTNGFHVENALDNKAARLSQFLNDKARTTKPVVGNVRYKYSTINNRKEWLYRSTKDSHSIKPGYGLVRKSDQQL